MSRVELLAARVPEQVSAEDYTRYCSPKQLQRMEARPEPDRIRSCVGQMLLTELFTRYGCSFVPPLALSYGPQGKPFLADFPKLFFNLSHSEKWVVCALSPVEVGVDLQAERPLRTSIVRKLHPSEQQLLQDLPDRAFFDLWTLKEAYCKCTGEGLRVPLNATAFTLSPVTVDRAGFQAALVPFPEEQTHLAICVKSNTLPEIHLEILN